MTTIFLNNIFTNPFLETVFGIENKTRKKLPNYFPKSVSYNIIIG